MLFIIYIPLILMILSTTPATSITPGGMSSVKPSPTTTTTPKLVLLDRDGVINDDLGAPGVLHPSKLRLTMNAGFGLGQLQRAGYKVALVTNQSCVGKGLITEKDLSNLHIRLQEMLLEEDRNAKFDQIFYCTSLQESDDHRRKPNPGMIEEAMALFAGDVDVSAFDNLFFVGDTLGDMEAAARAGVPTRILVETGYGRGIMGKEAPNDDGAVEVVNEKGSNIELTHMAENYDDDDVSSNEKSSIFPMLYAKNFSSAVEWILKITTTS